MPDTIVSQLPVIARDHKPGALSGEGRRRRDLRRSIGTEARALLRLAVFATALLCASCDPSHPIPPRLTLDGLPVSGDRALARQTGFTDCFNEDAIHVRCRRHGVMLYDQGPYEAAVDLRGGYGQFGFDQLTVWDDEDSDGVYKVIIALARQGWHYCYTGPEDRGDQAIFTRAGAAVRISMDISYWGKRRLRVIPNWNRQGLGEHCTPDSDLARFGTDVARAAAGKEPLVPTPQKAF